MNTENFEWTDNKIIDFIGWLAQPVSGGLAPGHISPSVARLRIEKYKREKSNILFTTKDGHKIMVGDRYFLVKDDFALESVTVTSISSINFTGHPCFFDKETAIKYVLDNKPLFSIRDIMSMEFLNPQSNWLSPLRQEAEKK